MRMQMKIKECENRNELCVNMLGYEKWNNETLKTKKNHESLRAFAVAVGVGESEQSRHPSEHELIDPNINSEALFLVRGQMANSPYFGQSVE